MPVSPTVLSDILSTPAGLPASFGIAGVIALAAQRAGSLSWSGAAAAVTIGAVALRVGWGWGALLIAWFVLASLLSRAGRARKARLTAAIVEKGDRRDALQVFANGGLFAAAALVPLTASLDAGYAAAAAITGAAALAAAGADTWATELGTLGGARPWSLRERRRVAPGTSGAVSLQGTVASLVGAFVIAALAAALGVVPQEVVPAVVAGGFVGSLVDTLIGAWWQSRRWCPACSLATERHVHTCGTPTRAAGGLRALDNDGVNFLCTAVGALVALLLGT